jgi:hypothetical protein
MVSDPDISSRISLGETFMFNDIKSAFENIFLK